MARALIREPDLLRRWEAEAAAAAAAAAAGGGGVGAGGVRASPCSHCNTCVVAALEGALASPRCVEREPGW
jgi:hypothetical protein